MFDSDEHENVSRWTRQRKLKKAFAAGREDGGSDLSSSDSGPEPAAQRRRVQESTSPDSSMSGSNDKSGHESGNDSEKGSEESSEGSDEDSEEELEGESGSEAEGEGGEELGEEDGDGQAHDHQMDADQEELRDGEPGENGDNQAHQQELIVDQAGVNEALEENEVQSSESGESSSESETGSESEADEESDNNDEEDMVHDGDGPLYENSRITHMESIMMILTFALTFSLSGQCLVRLLELIEIHCPAVNRCTTTLYKFKKIFIDIGRNILVLHYYCERCYQHLVGKDSICNNCQVNTQVAFFIEVPILNQLQRLFLRAGFLDKLSYRFNRQKKHAENLEDIYDGRLYKEHFGNNGFLRGLYNLSFMWYTDGISIFKSSKFSVWPLFFVINELSYKVRTQKENIILAGLWFGKKKPRPNLFLRPYRDFFETFRNNGFELRVPEGQPVNVKGMILCGTCDLQAKGLFLCMKLSNAYYGCSKCISRGESVPAGPRTSVRVHQYIPPNQMRLRNENQIPAYARSKQLGYKGLSMLYVLMPEMLRGVGVDVMHMVFLGLAKLLTKFWFDTKFSGEPYSCSGMIDVVNQRLANIKPPSFVQRFTRSFSDLKLWKAKEYKLWFFYYSPIVMNGVLENVYLQHHMKLVSGISLLSQGSIFPEQIDVAETLLNEYVEEFHALYTLRFMGMNLHLLQHICDAVRDLCGYFPVFFRI